MSLIVCVFAVWNKEVLLIFSAHISKETRSLLNKNIKQNISTVHLQFTASHFLYLTDSKLNSR